MNLLLTGSSGFLGKELKKNLLSEVDLFELNCSSGNYLFDLRDGTPIFDIPFNLVIHSAGKAHSVPKNEAEKQDFFYVNVKGTSNLLKGLEISGFPKSFVFISSVAVYGKESGNLVIENENLSAKDPYGQSKIQAEKLIQAWCEKHNVICTILRLPLIAGPNPPGNLGSMIKGIQKGYYFNIAGGHSKKSIVLAEDVAKIILKVSEIGGIYNLTDGHHPSFSELSSYITIQLGKGKPMNMPLWLAKIIANFGDFLGIKVPLNTNI
uniref:NAD-dependent epimerase/dehydratase family protein n=1 Tax=Flavobacterium sp. TaxID=239 RepID=UPI00404B927D